MQDKLQAINAFWLKQFKTNPDKIPLYFKRMNEVRANIKLTMTEDFAIVGEYVNPKGRVYRQIISDKEASCSCESRDEYCKHLFAGLVEIKDRF